MVATTIYLVYGVPVSIKDLAEIMGYEPDPENDNDEYQYFRDRLEYEDDRVHTIQGEDGTIIKLQAFGIKHDVQKFFNGLSDGLVVGIQVASFGIERRHSTDPKISGDALISTPLNFIRVFHSLDKKHLIKGKADFYFLKDDCMCCS